MIESLAPEGDGVGRLGGKVCFVRFSAPGDQLQVRVIQEKSRYLRAEIAEIAAPGPGRREPPCALFGRCGGCDWLHLEEPVQVQAKKAILGRALDVQIGDFFSSPRPLGYRRVARMRLALSPDRGLALGFLGARTGEVVRTNACPVLDPILDQALGPLREQLLDRVTGPAELRLAAGGSTAYLVVTTSEPQAPSFYEAAACLAPGRFGGILLSADRHLATVAGRDRLIVSGIDDRPLAMPVAGFGQANPEVNRMMGQTVIAWCRQGRFRRILELFAGAGNLTVGLAREAERLDAVEIDPDACRAARDNLSQRGLRNASVHQGDGLDFSRNALDRYDLIVLDPPRGGDRELARAIADRGPEAVLYVSCNPQTLRRDLELLREGGYRLSRVSGFDMFPQTAHVEAAALLER